MHHCSTNKKSEAITHCPPHNQYQYGAGRIGPAYPIWLCPASSLPGRGKIPYLSSAVFKNGIYSGEYAVSFGENARRTFHGIRIKDEMRKYQILIA